MLHKDPHRGVKSSPSQKDSISKEPITKGPVTEGSIQNKKNIPVTKGP